MRNCCVYKLLRSLLKKLCYSYVNLLSLYVYCKWFAEIDLVLKSCVSCIRIILTAINVTDPVDVYVIELHILEEYKSGYAKNSTKEFQTMAGRIINAVSLMIHSRHTFVYKNKYPPPPSRLY